MNNIGGTLFSPDEVIAKLSAIVSSGECNNLETALLSLMLSYDVDPKALTTVLEKGRKSFSKVSYAELRPYFDIPPTEPFDSLPSYRSRLPLDVVKAACSQLDLSAAVYGRLTNHNNEEARSRYLASLFPPLLSVFGGAIVNKPQELMEGEFTGSGKIEHVLRRSTGLLAFMWRSSGRSREEGDAER